MPRPHVRRLAGSAAGLLIAAAAVLGATPAASAATVVPTFESIDSSAVGCTGARINSISGAPDVRYYHRGQRLRFPTRVLPFNGLGIIELTARPTHGATVTQTHGRVLAPSACFTAITVGSSPRTDAVDSWCAGSPSSALGQVFESQSGETQVASWRLVRRADRSVVARGTVPLYLGVQPVSFPLPAGLPLGRYVLTVRNTASSPRLFPYSMEAEQYRCLPPATVRPGAVVFTVPAGGPDASIALYEGPPQAPTNRVTVRAGHRLVYRTSATRLDYIAYPLGHHVGTMGSGSVEIPPR